MLTLGSMHPWQGNDAVQQVLVFGSEEMKAQFEVAFSEEVKKHSLQDASDSNLGAIYKLRAVKLGNGKYAAVIRCGFTGKLLWECREDILIYDKPQQAIIACAAKLSSDMVTQLSLYQHSLQSIS